MPRRKNTFEHITLNGKSNDGLDTLKYLTSFVQIDSKVHVANIHEDFTSTAI